MEMEEVEFKDKLQKFLKERVIQEIKYDTFFKELVDFIGLTDLTLTENGIDFKEGNEVLSAFCGKIFEVDEVVYSCRQCSSDPTCVLCESCFKATDHEGHDINISLHSNGIGSCDCGDSEAFKNPLNCKIHSHDINSEYLARNLPDKCYRYLDVFLNVIFDYIIDVLRCVKASSFDCLDEEQILADTELMKEITEIRPLQDVYDLILWNDEKHSYTEVTNLLNKVCSGPDESEYITRLIDRVGRASIFNSSDITALIDLARPFVAVNLQITIRINFMTKLENLASELVKFLSILADTKLDKYLNGAFSSYFMQKVVEVLLLKYGEPISNEFQNNLESDNTPFDLNKLSEEILKKEDFYDNKFSAGKIYLFPLRRDVLVTRYDSIPLPLSNHFDFPVSLDKPGKIDFLEVTKLDWLIQLNDRLCKAYQPKLFSLLSRVLLVSTDFKLKVAEHFAMNYPVILRGIPLRPGNDYLRILTFSVQFFTSPKVIEHLHFNLNFVTCLFDLIIDDIGKNKYDHKNIYEYVLPEAISLDTFNNNEDNMFNRLSDLVYFLNSKRILETIPDRFDLLQQNVFLLALFQGVNAPTRKTGEHVRFEGNNFDKTCSIRQFVTDLIVKYSTAYQNSLDGLIRAIHYTLFYIHKWAYSGGPGLPFKTVAVHGKELRIVDYKVSSESTSLTYPLHWFLAALFIQLTQTSQYKSPYLKFGNLVYLILGADSEDFEARKHMLLMLLDYPLSSIVLQAQVLCKIWIRNGTDLLNDAYYFNNSYAMQTYTLFMCQMKLILFNSDQVLATFIDRFELSNLLAFDLNHDVYDEAQFVAMIANFLRFIIHLMSWRADIVGLSEEDIARYYIANNTFDYKNYNSVIKALPDKLKELITSDLMIEMCDYSPPEGLRDTGTYILKKKYGYLVDPYFYLNSQNQINEAEAYRYKCRTKQFVGLLNIESGPFKYIGDFIHTPFMAQVMYFTIYHDLMANKGYDLIDCVLQIYLIAIEDENSVYSVKDKNEMDVGGLWTNSIHKYAQNPSSTNEVKNCQNCVDMLLLVLDRNSDEIREAKLKYILAIFSKYGPQLAKDKIANHFASKESGDKDREVEFERLKKKRAAEARKAKMLESMKSAQSQFIDGQKNLYNEVEQVEGEIFESAFASNLDAPTEPYLTGNCIMCQEECNNDKLFGVISLVQPSIVLNQIVVEGYQFPDSSNDNGELVFTDSRKHLSMPHIKVEDEELQLPSGTKIPRGGLYVTSCGHLFHNSCFTGYFKAGLSPQFRSGIDGIRKKYIHVSCPLCKSVSNTFIPVRGNPGKEINYTDSKECGFEGFMKKLIDASRGGDGVGVESASQPGPENNFNEVSNSASNNEQIPDLSGSSSGNYAIGPSVDTDYAQMILSQVHIDSVNEITEPNGANSQQMVRREDNHITSETESVYYDETVYFDAPVEPENEELHWIDHEEPELTVQPDDRASDSENIDNEELVFFDTLDEPEHDELYRSDYEEEGRMYHDNIAFDSENAGHEGNLSPNAPTEHTNTSELEFDVGSEDSNFQMFVRDAPENPGPVEDNFQIQINTPQTETDLGDLTLQLPPNTIAILQRAMSGQRDFLISSHIDQEQLDILAGAGNDTDPTTSLVATLRVLASDTSLKISPDLKQTDLEPKLQNEHLSEDLVRSLVYTISMLEVSDRSRIHPPNSSNMPLIIDRVATKSLDTTLLLWNATLVKFTTEDRPLVTGFKPPSLFPRDTLKDISSFLKMDPFLLMVQSTLYFIEDKQVDFFSILQVCFNLQILKLLSGTFKLYNQSRAAEISASVDRNCWITSLIHSGIVAIYGQEEEQAYSKLAKLKLDTTIPFIHQQLSIFLKKVLLFMATCQISVPRDSTASGDELTDGLQIVQLNFELIRTNFLSVSSLNLFKSICNLDPLLPVHLDYPYAYRPSPLPKRLDTLFNTTLTTMNGICQNSGFFVCMSCNQINCGAMYCLDSGAANPRHASIPHHAKLCHGLLGLYLVPKKNMVLLYTYGVCFNVTTPYLTIHGMSYPVGNSGLPQLLNEKRYLALYQRLLEHTIINEVNYDPN